MLLLAGLIGLPVFASEPQTWSFNGTEYTVTEQGSQTSVSVSRERELTKTQMKALCRKGLGLGLRKYYEDQLIERAIIKQRFATWPFANLTYELSDIQFSRLDNTQAVCSATLKDTGYKTNLQTTALNYAIAYYSTERFGQIKPVLPLLIQEPEVAMDAAGLVTLLMSHSNPEKAAHYYQQYVDVSALKRDEVKMWLAKWQYDSGQFAESLAITQACSSHACERLGLDIEDKLFEQQAESAGDLSSYF
jgi:hypothetical protein